MITTLFSKGRYSLYCATARVLCNSGTFIAANVWQYSNLTENNCGSGSAGGSGSNGGGGMSLPVAQ